MRQSTLSTKFQATIPKEIRKKLGLKAGDSVVFRIEKDGSIRLEKAQSYDSEYLKSVEQTLSEWSSKEDDDAFENLQNL